MGGSSGGGSSSGSVEYMDYMVEHHNRWLNQLENNIISAKVGNSPFAELVSPDPDSNLAAMWSAVCTLETAVDAISVTGSFSTMVALAMTKVDAAFDAPTFVNSTPAAASAISDSVAAWTAIYNEEVDNVTIPKFRGGMRDIGAVMSSAFVLGEAYLDASRDRDIANYQAELRMKTFLLADELNSREAMAENEFNLKIELSKADAILKTADSLLTKQIAVLEYRKIIAHYAIEAKRLAIAALNEQATNDTKFIDMDSRWDFDIYQYGANMLAAISGGVATPPQRSQGMSALGGALSGAASGAMVGSSFGPYGTAIGAGVGAIAGYAMSS